MDRCHACEGYRDVQLVNDLAWCSDCRDGDLPELYASGCAPMFMAAVNAEVARRLPVQRNSAEKQTS